MHAVDIEEQAKLDFHLWVRIVHLLSECILWLLRHKTLAEHGH